MIGYRSPSSGRPLTPDSAHSLSDGQGERWPVIDDIAYLRAGSEALAAEALARLDAGDESGALVLLLAENDRWWPEPPPPPAQLERLVAGRDRLSLRAAMELLGWGRVGDYFAHRWSDPTFAAGCALIDAHWTAPKSAFELACGIGHYLRLLGQAGVAATGADVVFAKLWVARHWVAPGATLVCFDAEAPWPIDLHVDLACCHDAFYFLGDKAGVAKRLREIAPVLLMAHIHNKAHANLSSGASMTLVELTALFPEATLYADEELTAAASAGRLPRAGADETTEAFALALGAEQRTTSAGFGLPAPGALLVRNPLCTDEGPLWPSPRYAEEYGARATYECAAVPERTAMAPGWLDAVRRRELLALPERW